MFEVLRLNCVICMQFGQIQYWNTLHQTFISDILKNAAPIVLREAAKKVIFLMAVPLSSYPPPPSNLMAVGTFQQIQKSPKKVIFYLKGKPFKPLYLIFEPFRDESSLPIIKTKQKNGTVWQFLVQSITFLQSYSLWLRKLGYSMLQPPMPRAFI